MKRLIPLMVAAMFVAGCGNNNSGDQSTNAPAEQPPTAASTNLSSADETTNSVSSVGMDTNNPATTNGTMTTTNATPQ